MTRLLCCTYCFVELELTIAFVLVIAVLKKMPNRNCFLPTPPTFGFIFYSRHLSNNNIIVSEWLSRSSVARCCLVFLLRSLILISIQLYIYSTFELKTLKWMLFVLSLSLLVGMPGWVRDDYVHREKKFEFQKLNWTELNERIVEKQGRLEFLP